MYKVMLQFVPYLFAVSLAKRAKWIGPHPFILHYSIPILAKPLHFPSESAFSNFFSVMCFFVSVLPIVIDQMKRRNSAIANRYSPLFLYSEQIWELTLTCTGTHSDSFEK